MQNSNERPWNHIREYLERPDVPEDAKKKVLAYLRDYVTAADRGCSAETALNLYNLALAQILINEFLAEKERGEPPS